MSTLGRLRLAPAGDHLDLVGPPVTSALGGVSDAMVAEIDPDLADTAALCEAYDVPMDVSAN